MATTELSPNIGLYHGARKFVYRLLVSRDIETALQKKVRILIGVLILLSVISVILESEPTLRAAYGSEFYAFEVLTIFLFAIEYVLRLWAVVEQPPYQHWFFGRLRYVVTPLAIIDLISFLPFFIPAIIPFDLRFIRSIRLIRLLRILKLGHYSQSLATITRVLKDKRSEIAASFVVVTILLVLASTLMYYAEHEAQPNAFRSILSSMWWGLATLSKSGNRDLLPITTVGKILASIISMLGIGVFALPSAIFASGFIEEMRKRDDKLLCSRCQTELTAEEREAG